MEAQVAAKIDLAKMSLDELKTLKKDVDKAIAGFKDKKRAEALKEIQAVAKKHGLPLDELVGGKGRKTKAKTPPKYRNPENASDTWSGRGRQPEWYKSALKSGKKPEQLAI
jgi:DNA-binding protein H-NS